MANYPENAVSFGSPRVDLVNSVLAEDVNILYREVTAIASDLGAGSMGSGTPGLRYSSAWGVGSFSSTTTTWSGLQARLQNIEKGLYQAYYNRVDLKGTANFNTIQSVDANTIGLSIKAGTLTASITSATADGVTVDYTANNSFSVGQKVTITGLTATTGNPLLNYTLKEITALIGTSPNYTGFSIAAPTVTGVTGSTSGSSTALTAVGDVSNVIVGMTVAGTNIVSGTKVSAISGQSITLNTASSGTVSGSLTFTTVGATSGVQSGTANAYQTTSLQRWQKSDGTVVASVSPDGNFVAAGSGSFSGAGSFGGNTSITGTISVTGAGTLGGNLSVTGSITATGELTASVINGGTP